MQIVASDRTDTVVDIRPSDETDESDVEAAQGVRVDFTNGTLRVAGPKSKTFDFSRNTRSVDVTIELPSGSQVSGRMQIGDFHWQVGWGVRFKTSVGNLRSNDQAR